MVHIIQQAPNPTDRVSIRMHYQPRRYLAAKLYVMEKPQKTIRAQAAERGRQIGLAFNMAVSTPENTLYDL